MSDSERGASPAPGVLLVNLGTPDAPTAGAVRRYLRPFLSDPRVVELPRLVWLPILYFLILPFRPAKSAAKYAKIWTRDGSPLRVYSERQAQILKGSLGERLRALVPVESAMSYGTPSIPQALARLKERNCDRVLVIPLYPQYTSSATGSVEDAIARAMRKWKPAPELRIVREFHAHRAYAKAIAKNVNDYWLKHGRPDRLLMSFHGIPRKTVDRGDPYQAQCLATGRLLAAELGLTEAQYRITFQSRFGRAEWLKPYTADVLAELGRARTDPVDVVCPGFVSDCLETLEEIAIEGRQIYTEAGGKTLRYIPCLNDRHEWIAALTDLTARNLLGWVEAREPTAGYRPFGVSAF